MESMTLKLEKCGVRSRGVSGDEEESRNDRAGEGQKAASPMMHLR